jgi:hypothetical protein
MHQMARYKNIGRSQRPFRLPGRMQGQSGYAPKSGHVWVTDSGLETAEGETTGGDRHEHHMCEEKTRRSKLERQSIGSKVAFEYVSECVMHSALIMLETGTRPVFDVEIPHTSLSA